MFIKFISAIRHKRIVSVIFLIVFSQLLASFIVKPVSVSLNSNIYSITPNDSIIVQDSSFLKSDYNVLISDSLANFSKKYLGVKYRRGSRSNTALDCSGFTSLVYEHFGYKLERTAHGQATQGVNIEKKDVKKGDLVFFKGRNQKSNVIGHVGIAISNENEKISFIHASVNNGISYDNTESSYYKTRYVCSRRIIKERDSLRFIKLAQDSFPKSNDLKNHNINLTEEYHIVKKGDNLYAISKMYKCSVDDLKNWNKLSSNNISLGQKLIISPTNKDCQANKTNTEIKTSDSKKNEDVIYIVKKGDNLWSISRRYTNVSVEDIRKRNNLTPESKLPIGLKLMIPLK